MLEKEGTQPLIAFDRKQYTDDFLIEVYKELLYPRMIEEKMLVLLRQGQLSKWFSGIGQEGVAVGAAMALRPEDYVYTLHRNLGVFTHRRVPLERLICQFQGKPNGFTNGRDRSFHFGLPAQRIIGMISHLGAMLGVADGTALGAKLDDVPEVSLAFTGDGTTSEGDFHEAVNTAAVWDLPVIFLIENNGYGLSTPSREQFCCESFTDKAPGYGIEGYQVTGNNVLEVYEMTQRLAEDLRQRPRPVILEAMTFRRRGHEEASGTKYVPQELMDYWAARDPVDNYELFLQQAGVLSEEDVKSIRKDFKQQINKHWETAKQAPDVTPDQARELRDVYAPSDYTPAQPPAQSGGRTIRYVDAVSEGMWQAMEQHPDLILMGQDIAEYGGVFKVTEGFVDHFGHDRVRNTTLCESGIIGLSMGLSLKGRKSMVEMQFADFVSCGFNQIVNNLAKTHYRWGHAPDVVIRMPTGAGVAAGPFHSQSDEAWFFHTPGLKIVYPSNPYDAKGLLTTAFQEPNPVLYFEHKYLYRRSHAEVPEAYYNLPLGVAAQVQAGSDISIITYGMGVHWALAVQAQRPAISLDIIDLRSLMPWDQDAILNSLRRTGKMLVLHEDTLTGGIGAEIAAWAMEHGFTHLDAPIMRVGALDTPVPFNPALEEQFLPKERLLQKLDELHAF
jgi:2-oxoisovalerate dehydrogenase E1 component